MNRHTLAVVMINRADAVARISGLLAARNIRLESIIGGPTDDPDYFLFSIIVEADEAQALRTQDRSRSSSTRYGWKLSPVRERPSFRPGGRGAARLKVIRPGYRLAGVPDGPTIKRNK